MGTADSGGAIRAGWRRWEGNLKWNHAAVSRIHTCRGFYVYRQSCVQECKFAVGKLPIQTSTPLPASADVAVRHRADVIALSRRGGRETNQCSFLVRRAAAAERALAVRLGGTRIGSGVRA